MNETGAGSVTQVQSLPNSRDSVQRASAFYRKPRLLVVTMIGLFVLAGAVRLLSIEAPGLALDREYRSALIARAYYFEMANTVPEWRRDVAVVSLQRQGVLEPPVMELLVALVYRFVNGEHLWIARLLSSALWLVGGVFLLKVAERIVSFEAAVFSAAYYLFVPLGVMASRSFQPDTLMIMLFVLSLHMMLRYHDHPSGISLLVAASVSGFAALTKPLVLFVLLSAFFSLALSENGDLKRVFDLRFLVYMVVSLSPAMLFYICGILNTYSLRRQVQGSFLPQLLLSLEYWKQWLLTATGAIGYTPLVAGLVGLPLLRKGVPRALLLGLWIGYAAFCLVFTNHIRFAGYYHLQLIVIVALSFGPITSLIINHLRLSSNQWYWWMPIVGGLVLTLLLDIREVRGRLAAPRLLEREEVAQEIGEIVGHSTKTVYVAYQYGTPLEYYGELSGSYWPRSISDRDRALGLTRVQSVEERLNDLDFFPEYFVITDFDQYTRHHSDLREYLARSCRLVTKSDEYLVYGACTE